MRQPGGFPPCMLQICEHLKPKTPGGRHCWQGGARLSGHPLHIFIKASEPARYAAAGSVSALHAADLRCLAGFVRGNSRDWSIFCTFEVLSSFFSNSHYEGTRAISLFSVHLKYFGEVHVPKTRMPISLTD